MVQENAIFSVFMAKTWYREESQRLTSHVGHQLSLRLELEWKLIYRQNLDEQ